ncbi:MAG: hypothetical protein KC620_19305, partial [Myxococcales bacterium]|nr:hypothetical protein [Myxococcales bacterium]
MQKLTMEALAEEVETEARQSAPPPNAPNYAALAQSAEMSGAAHALPPAMAAAAGQSAEMPDREAEAARRGLEREKTAHRLLTPPAGPSQALVPYRSPDETLGLPPQMAAAPTYQLAPGVAERLGPSGPSAALAAESAPALTPQTGAIVPYRGGLDPETERLIRSWLDESAQDQTPDTPADVAFAAEEPVVQPAIAAAEAEARAAPVEQAGPSALAQREAVEADAQAAPERLAAVEAEAQRGPTGAGQPTVA